MKKLKIKWIIKRSNNFLLLIKGLLIYLLIMFTVICYYYFINKYILNINSEEVATCTITTIEIFEPTEVTNIWYKSIIDDFFNKFTKKSKTIEHKYFEIQSFTIIEHNQDIKKKSILDNINNLVSECEYYKEKISHLEIQTYYTKMIHNNLINDLHEILKDVDQWRK